jgi:Rap1a immunity proteins
MRWHTALAVLAVLWSGPSRGEEEAVSGTFWVGPCENNTQLCAGYLAAVFDTNNMLVAFYNRPMFCLPDTVTVAHARTIVVKTMQDEPSTQHLPFLTIAIAALQKSFPCASGTQTVWQTLSR